MKLKQSEIDFIAQKIDNGKKILECKKWNDILDKLGDLQLDIGYTDSTYDEINDTGRYIERLIDKIAYDEGNDDILEIEDD